MKKNFIVLTEMVYDENFKNLVPVFKSEKLFISEVNKNYDLLFVNKFNDVYIRLKN